MSSGDAKYHTVIIILPSFGMLLPKGYVGAKSVFLHNCLRSNIVRSQVIGERGCFPYLTREADSGQFQRRTHGVQPSFPPWHQAECSCWPVWAEVLVRLLLHVAHCSGPGWFWKVCCLLCRSSWSGGILQTDDGNILEEIFWFWINMWKLECLSTMLILNSESYPLSTAGTLACMFWTWSSQMVKSGLRIQKWREAASENRKHNCREETIWSLNSKYL